MTSEMNRSRFLVPLFLVTIVALGGMTRPAAAGAWFSIGGSFEVGGVHFQVGVHDYRPASPPPVRYYRVDAPLYVAGARCTDRCYVQRGYHYHHESCPLVRGYLVHYGYSPARVAPALPYYRYTPPAVVYPSIRPYGYVYPAYPIRPNYRVTPGHDRHHGHGHDRWDDHHRGRRGDHSSYSYRDHRR